MWTRERTVSLFSIAKQTHDVSDTNRENNHEDGKERFGD
jgi:hypothetical protein